MNTDQALRNQLVALLRGGQAYMPFDEAVGHFPMDQINAMPATVPYSFWHLLEHMRIAQYDSLDRITNSDYVAPEWPSGYWPARAATTNADGWQHTLSQFHADQNTLIAIIANPANDLAAPLPHDPQQTLLREILVLADHNAYHTGEFAILRQVMNLWPQKH